MSQQMSKINRDHLDKFYEYDLWLEGRTLYIGANASHNFTEEFGPDEISCFTTEKIIKGLSILDNKPSEPIKIILNSPGGSLSQALAIYDAILRSPCYIEILATGQCMSAATIILQAADKRVLSQNCLLMVHDGHDEISGSPTDVMNWSKIGQMLTTKMYKIYERTSGRSEKYWQKKCQRDYILTAADAVAEGLADEII